MAFNPNAQWLVCVTADLCLVLIPIYFLLTNQETDLEQTVAATEYALFLTCCVDFFPFSVKIPSSHSSRPGLAFKDIEEESGFWTTGWFAKSPTPPKVSLPVDCHKKNYVRFLALTSFSRHLQNLVFQD